MRRIGLMLVALMLMGVSAVAVGAQSNYAIGGLVVSLSGDLHEWNGSEMTALTSYGANGQLIQSPDGRYIAYRSMPEEALEDSQFAGGERPMNIWILDRQTGDFQRVADSANGLRFRGQPAWSPDSTRLAWTELIYASEFPGALDLVSYDLRTSTRTTLTSNFTLGPSDGGLYMPPLHWGEAGISHLYSTVIMGPNPGQMIFELYDANNGAMTSYTVGQTQDTYIVDYVWAQHRGESSVVFVTREGDWWVLNPFTGAREDLTAPPTLHTTFGISNISVTPRFQRGDMGFDFAWDMVFQSQGNAPTVTTLPYTSPLVRGRFTPAIGEGVAWNYEGTVVVQQVEGAQTVSQDTNFTPGMADPYGGAVWYSTGWQTTISTDAPPPVVIPTPTIPAVGCEAPLFGPGNQIRVTNGAPNNLRSDASTSSPVLGRLPAGTGMTVLSPAVCNEGYYWYRVQGSEWQGWTAAGPNHAWLERVPGTPIEPCPLPPRLSPGQLTAVTEGVPNNLRTEPGRGAPVSAQLPAGTIMEIVNGPACVDGLYWYQVLGSEWRGWTAEGENGVYWLRPFTPSN